MINPDDIIILCPWLKRILFLEDSLWRLWDAGFKNIWIQQTSLPTFGYYEGPSSKFFEGPITDEPITAADNTPLISYKRCLYPDALRAFQQELRVEQIQYKYIFLMDYDLFFTDTKEFCKILEEIITNKYDYVGRLYFKKDIDRYNWRDKYIVNLLNSSISPFPVIATGWEFFTRELWETTGSNGRYELAQDATQKGLKVGILRSDKSVADCAWGKEWFHLSRLTRRYVVVDNKRYSEPNPKHPADQAWWGFFAKQKQVYGNNIFPEETDYRLNLVFARFGGKDTCLRAWDEFVKGTPMEKWKRYDRS